MIRYALLAPLVLLLVFSSSQAQDTKPPDSLADLPAQVKELHNFLRHLSGKLDQMSTRLEALEKRLDKLESAADVTTLRNFRGGRGSGYLRFPVEVEEAMMGEAQFRTRVDLRKSKSLPKLEPIRPLKEEFAPQR